MRRRIGIPILALTLMLLMAAARAQRPDDKQNEPFTFLQITDTEVTADQDPEALRKLVNDAVNMSPRPAFILHTGNLTHSGRPEEYARFLQAIAPLKAAGIGFYAVPGNRDIRWSPDGKESFSRAFGKPYQSFDYGFAHFLLLDSTVLLENWGHFDKAQLDWLNRDLKHVKPETPVFLVMHFPIGRRSPGDRLVDNEFDLIPILRGHNVMAAFMGHGRVDLTWKVNGVTAVMARPLDQGSYHKVHVTPLLVTIERYMEGQAEPAPIASLPVSRRANPSVLRVTWDDPDVMLCARKRPAATLIPRAVADNPDREKAEYRLDDGDWKPMTKDARDIWRDTFLTKDVPIGVHTTDIRLTTSNNIAYQAELYFELEREYNEPTRKWAIDLDGPIQSSPLLALNTLYVSCLDGHLYALDPNSSKRHWAFPIKGEFVASPVLAGDTIYIGGTDHYIYALDAATGKKRWGYDTGSPVFATAAVAQGVVCVGGSGHIVGLDAGKGTPRWTQPAGGFFQSRAATDGATFYLGGWDNTVYALDAATGDPKWKVKLGQTFENSPAIASPAVGDGRVYVCTNDGSLHCLDAQTGANVWTTPAPLRADQFGYSSPVLSGPTIFLAGLGANGDVYAVDAASGKILWRKPTGQPIYDSSPKLAPDGKSLAIMALRGRVSVLDTQTGERLWSYELGPGNIFSTPEYDGKVVYTVTMANDVQALNGPLPPPGAQKADAGRTSLSHQDAGAAASDERN
jgi:outer membrane protein assembly factor BamB